MTPDLFTVHMQEDRLAEYGPELHEVHDFETCSAALDRATLYASRQPNASVTVWLNRRRILWESHGYGQPPAESDWHDGWRPGACGRYSATYGANDWLPPTFHLITSRDVDSHAKGVQS